MYSKGVMWLDDTRIPFVDTDIPSGGYGSASIGYGNEYEYSGGAGKSNQQGRFTPNLLVCDDMLNDGNVSEAKANLNYKWNNTDGGGDIFNNRGTYTPRNDKGTNSRYYDLDLWFEKMIEKL